MAARRRHSWFERHPAISLLAILSIVLIGGLAAVEKVLERRHEAAGLDFTNTYERLIRLRETRPNSLTIFDRTHEGVTEKVLLRGDENGFIEPSRVHEKPDAQIVFLGGSTTEAYQVRETLRFPYLAGRLLESRLGIAINSHNGGRGANHSMHSNFVLLGKVLPMKPDMVVVMHAINDLSWHRKTNGDYWTLNPDPNAAFGDIWDQYLLVKTTPLQSEYRNLTDLLRNIKNATIPYTWLTIRSAFETAKQDPTLLMAMSERGYAEYSNSAEGPETPFTDIENLALANFRKSMETLVGTARIWGIEPVLMTQPRLIGLTPTSRNDLAVLRLARLHDAANQVVRDLAREKDVILVDLYAMVDAQPEKPRFFIDKIHYSDAGSEFIAHRVAETLAPEICRRKLLPAAKCPP